MASEPGHHGMPLVHGEIPVVQWTAAVGGRVAPVRLPYADVDLFHVQGIPDHVHQGPQDLVEAQAAGHLGGVLPQPLRLADLLFHKKLVKKPSCDKVNEHGGQHGHNGYNHHAGGGQHGNLHPDQRIQGLGQVVERHHADSHRDHVAVHPGHQHGQAEHPAGVQGIEHHHRVAHAGQNINGEAVEHRQRQIAQEQKHFPEQQGQHLGRHSRLFPGPHRHSHGMQHDQKAQAVHDAHLPLHVVHKPHAAFCLHQPGRSQQPSGF